MEKEDNSNIGFAKNIIYFYRNHKKRAIWLFFITGIAYGLTNVAPLILSKIIDLFISENPNVENFYFLLGALLLIGIISTILRLTNKNKLGRLRLQIVKEMKVEMMQKLMSQELSWHQKENTGSKLHKISSGLTGYKQVTDYLRQEGIETFVATTLILSVFFALSPKYFLLAVIWMITYLFIEVKFNKIIAEKNVEVNKQTEIASGKITEFTSNMTTVKSLGMESSITKKIEEQENQNFKLREKLSKLANKKWIYLQLNAVTFNAIFLFFVGRDILWGELSAGSIIIYTAYIAKITSILNNISSSSDTLIESRNQIARMMAMFPKEEKRKGTKNLGNWKQIRFQKTSFKYKDTNVLSDFDMTIKKGQKIGIVGFSGSGKSTMFKLLLKNYEVNKGDILFDNENIKDLLQEDLLAKIAVVPQETELFNLSIRQNITMSEDLEVDYDKYALALEISSSKSFIVKLKNKDNSRIGEKGLRLSGGERQRIGIARAIYKDPQVLILDEATSSLDYKTEKNISQAFQQKLKDKTIIIAAHRLSTLREMDKIYVIKDGRVAEEGSYAELEKKKGLFNKLLKSQAK